MKRIYTILVVMLLSSASMNVMGQAGKDKVLETLGGTSTVMVYNTYGMIGMLADSWAEDLYETDYILEMVDEQLTMLESVSGMLVDLKSSGFLSDPNDVESIQTVIDICGLLEKEGTALKEYISSEDEELGDKYDEFREAAWDEISEFMGLDE